MRQEVGSRNVPNPSQTARAPMGRACPGLCLSCSCWENPLPTLGSQSHWQRSEALTCVRTGGCIRQWPGDRALPPLQAEVVSCEQLALGATSRPAVGPQLDRRRGRREGPRPGRGRVHSGSGDTTRGLEKRVCGECPRRCHEVPRPWLCGFDGNRCPLGCGAEFQKEQT